MKTPLVLKPGSAEPWTPWRIIQAFLMAGLPPEAFCYYPTDHAGGNEILRQVGRGMLFGDVGAVKGWAKDPRIELHGPGYSKIVIGEDCIEDWPKYVELMAKSVAENGGRSCVNCSGIWVPRYGKEIARAVAERLLEIQPRSADDPDAVIAPFANPDVGRRVDSLITQGLADSPGAVDVSEQVRGTPRLVEHDGCVFLVPTIVHCDSPCHPMANREYLFPFASVVEAPQEEMPEILGPTLVVTALTKDREFLDRLLTSHLVGRLNIGPCKPTSFSGISLTKAISSITYGRAERSRRRNPNLSPRGEAMRILSLTAGAAQMYCGSCLRDNALARELIRQGHEVSLIPLYTPTKTDEPNQSSAIRFIRWHQCLPAAEILVLSVMPPGFWTVCLIRVGRWARPRAAALPWTPGSLANSPSPCWKAKVVRLAASFTNWRPGSAINRAPMSSTSRIRC